MEFTLYLKHISKGHHVPSHLHSLLFLVQFHLKNSSDPLSFTFPSSLLQQFQVCKGSGKSWNDGWGLFSVVLITFFHFLSPSLRCWLPSCPGRTHVQTDHLPALIFLIISGHCCHHLCSSHWPPVGDAGLFCCSTCGHPAARALGSTGTLQSLPAPKPTPVGRGGQTSPRTARTWL